MSDKKKNPAAVKLGRLGGLKGGKARAEALSPERRKEIAEIASRARWKREPPNDDDGAARRASAEGAATKNLQERNIE